MINNIFELNYGQILAKQKSIVRLFPSFYDRVKAVEKNGGVTGFKESGPGLWEFTVASGDPERHAKGVQYRIRVTWIDILPQVKHAAFDLNNWTKDKERLNLMKVADYVMYHANMKLSSTSPGDNWWGNSYVRTKRDTELDFPQHIAPVVRNPKEYGIAGKHVQLIMNVLPFYVQTMANHLKRYYAKDILAIQKEVYGARFKSLAPKDKTEEPAEEKPEEPVKTTKPFSKLKIKNPAKEPEDNEADYESGVAESKILEGIQGKYWLTPKGGLLTLSYEHSDYLADKNLYQNQESPVDYAIKKGWVRVGYIGSILYIQIKEDSSANDKILSLINKFKPTEIAIDVDLNGYLESMEIPTKQYLQYDSFEDAIKAFRRSMSSNESIILHEYFNKLIREDGEGGAVGATTSAPGTTSANIAYVPGQFKRVTSKLSTMSKRKRNWKTQVVKLPEARVVHFEDAFEIYVKESYWPSFAEKCFGSCLFSLLEFTSDLGDYLAEAQDDELILAKEDLKKSLMILFNNDVLKGYQHKLAEFVKIDPNVYFYQVGKSLLTEPGAERQIQQMIALIEKAYQKDLGAYQTLTAALRARQPLNSLPIFRNIDNLLGTTINGKLKGVEFNYSSVVTMNFLAQEWFQTSNKDLIHALEIQPAFFKVKDGRVYPASENGFPYNFVEYLNRI